MRELHSIRVVAQIVTTVIRSIVIPSPFVSDSTVLHSSACSKKGWIVERETLCAILSSDYGHLVVTCWLAGEEKVTRPLSCMLKEDYI